MAMQIRYRVNGEEVSQEAFRELPSNVGEMLSAGAPPMTVADYRNPVETHQLAVHPSQVKEAMDDAVKKGVPTEFLADGRPRMRTKQHMREYLKAYGFRRREKGEGVKRIDIDATCAEYGIENPAKRRT